jgi:hypothetical protein
MSYCTITNVRSVQGLDDVSIYPDAVVTAAIAQADELIDAYCGTSFSYKNFTVTLDGNNLVSIRIPSTPFIRSITSATVDGVAQTTTNWALRDEGVITRDTSYFVYTHPGLNVVISGTAGATSTPPTEIVWASRTLAIGNILQLENRVPDRALSVQSEFGNIAVAQAGGQNRPTEYPAVNAVLNRHKHRPPMSF